MTAIATTTSEARSFRQPPTRPSMHAQAWSIFTSVAETFLVSADPISRFFHRLRGNRACRDLTEVQKRAADRIRTDDLLHGNCRHRLPGSSGVRLVSLYTAGFPLPTASALAGVSRRFVAVLLPPRCPDSLESGHFLLAHGGSELLMRRLCSAYAGMAASGADDHQGAWPARRRRGPSARHAIPLQSGTSR